MDSILDTLLQLLNDDPDAPAYKLDVMTFANGVFGRLKNLGIGPKEGFYITDSGDSWDDFMDEGPERAAVQTYMFMKVKLIFDPPQNSTVLQSYERLVNEFEWSAAMDSEAKAEGSDE